MEWVLVNNIRNLERIRVDHEGLLTIKDAYKSYYQEEIRFRNQLESKIKQYYVRMGDSNPEAKMRSHISMMKDRDSVDEDAHQCKYCTDLCYLSFAMCKVHTMTENVDKQVASTEPVMMTKQEKRAKQVAASSESQ